MNLRRPSRRSNGSDAPRSRIAIPAALLVAIAAAGAASAGTTAIDCLDTSGDAASRCLRRYTMVLEHCRNSADAACEEDARADDGRLDRARARAEENGAGRCSDESARSLGYLGADDVAPRVGDACTDFGEDFAAVTYADEPGGLSSRELDCQRVVARALDRLRRRVVHRFGPGCFAPAFAGEGCDRARRDTLVARARRRARREILYRCGGDFDGLGLVPSDAGSTLAGRVDALLDVTVTRARHFAQLVFPPNDLGPTADFGPFPVGVTTLELVDASRDAADGSGPRPVTTEVYYPSTAAAVAGVPGDIVSVLGVDLVETPAFRDVAPAPGSFPLVLFSHGNNGIRFQSFFFTAHLASHGYIVATPDHHGNTFTDGLLGVVDTGVVTNRPLDMRFLIDELTGFDTEPGNFFEGAIDLSRIGMSGHSFGGYTAFALAGGAFGAGTFTDPRIKAIFPQAPSAILFSDDFFETITIPTLIVGGSIDETTPFEVEQERPFENLPSNASLVGLVELRGAGHFTFSDFCEVPRDLLSFLGGFDEACEPRHLPWRHAHDIVNYLGLNFFDAVLNDDAEALARLAPENVAAIEDVDYWVK